MLFGYLLSAALSLLGMVSAGHVDKRPVIPPSQRINKNCIHQPGLRTTAKKNIKHPRTIAEAKAEGWELFKSCQESKGQFFGHRYMNRSDPTIMLIFDDAGFIAGIQISFFKKLANEKYYPFSTADPYQEGDWFGETLIHNTVYFVNPNLICNGGRTREEFDKCGTSDRLWVQLGRADEHRYTKVPYTMEAADRSLEFYRHICYPFLGEHYNLFNYDPEQSCSGNNIQPIYDKGYNIGFSYRHYVQLPGGPGYSGHKWERVMNETVMRFILRRPPKCLKKLMQEVGFSAIHIFLNEDPARITCPMVNMDEEDAKAFAARNEKVRLIANAKNEQAIRAGIPLHKLRVKPSCVHRPGLKTTFKKFVDRPRTVADAKKEGWELFKTCEESRPQFLGHRYMNRSDPSVMLIYDDAGYIAGIQFSFFKNLVDENFYPFSTAIAYQEGDWFGEKVIHTTVYFVNPALICTGGRTAEEFAKCGTGDRVWLQLGSAKNNKFLKIPDTQADADRSLLFHKHICTDQMGEHYNLFNYDPDQSCNGVQIQPTFDQGHNIGFSYRHYVLLNGGPGYSPDKWEMVRNETIVRSFIRRPPKCLIRLVKEVGFSSMHIFFNKEPRDIKCPPIVDKRVEDLEAFANRNVKMRMIAALKHAAPPKDIYK